MPSRPARAPQVVAVALLACVPFARARAAEGPALPGPSLSVFAEGLRDRTRDGGDPSREAALGLRLRLPVLESVRGEGAGRSAWGLGADAEARVVALDLPEADGLARFVRLGAGVSGFYAPSPRAAFRLQLGAFVAEQAALLGSAALHPRVVALGTHRAGDTVHLLYGVGYTYDFGRGLPIPFLGAIWRMAPAWRLDLLLPIIVRATYTATEAVSVDFGTAVAGEQFRYRVAGPAGAPGTGRHELLHVARLRLGAGCGIAVARAVRVALGAGVEGARVDSGLSTRTALGAYVTASLRVGGRRGGDAFGER